MRYSIEYFNSRVQRDIQAWLAGILANFVEIARRVVEHGPNLGLPYTRAIGKGLFELRAHGPEGIGRALFCTMRGKRVVVLHAFIKKTQQTSVDDMHIARQRLKEVT